MISITNYLFENEKKDPTKLGADEKLLGGAAIIGGLGAGALGYSRKRTAEIAREAHEEALQRELGEPNTLAGKIYRELWAASQDPEKRNFNQQQIMLKASEKLGKSIGDTGLGVAAAAAAGLGAHKLYKMYKNKKK